MSKLTNVAIKALLPREKAYKVSDGRGLLLLISPAGGKLWRFDYRFSGKRKDMALGAWPAVSLAAARQQRDRLREVLTSGLDPSKGIAGDRTFKDTADLWWQSRKGAWTERYAQTVRTRLDNDMTPTFGDRLMGGITSQMALDGLRQMEARGAIEAAHRMRNVVREIFDFHAADIGQDLPNPTRNLGKALSSRPPKVRRAALRVDALPDFYCRLAAYDLDDMTKDALRLTILAAVRTVEAIGARVEEFERLGEAEPLWRIPATRMKMKSEHLIPLAPQVVQIVQKYAAGRSHGLLLPRPTRSGQMSNNTMLYAMYRLGYHGRATVHGFRGTFSTAANEAGWNSEWIERQLAHVERDEVRHAYNAAEYLPGRRKLLEWWADLNAGQAMIGDMLG